MTAENLCVDGSGRPVDAASMRPRPMTAENPDVGRRRDRHRRRFNEAAADDRGKPSRVFVENSELPSRFNEAAADDRGKPPASKLTQRCTMPLQ